MLTDQADKPIKVLFPKTEEEIAEATRLYEEGLAASGEDQPVEELEEPTQESDNSSVEIPKVSPSPFVRSNKGKEE